MKVYVVVRDNNQEGLSVEGVFATKARAEEFIGSPGSNPFFYVLYIQEHEMDELDDLQKSAEK